MYIDTLEKGKNPLSLFMTANDADYGKLGQAASQYLNDPEYRTLRKDADFIAAIAALHHADENVMKAELCIGITDDSRKRVFVERRSTPRSYDDLWTNEAIFLNYLAKAQVELTEAVRRLETAAKSPEGTRIGINRTLVASTRENLEKFNAAIERIDANALFKVEELAENIKPEHVAEAINYRNLDREGWAG